MQSPPVMQLLAACMTASITRASAVPALATHAKALANAVLAWIWLGGVQSRDLTCASFPEDAF
jgi:hypothetical protein